MHPVRNDPYRLEHIDIEVTHACNLGCVHCSASANGGKNAQTLDNAEIERIVGTAMQIGLKRIGLTGGEPLIDSERLSSIAHLCRDKFGIPLHMHTNGTLVTRDMVKASGVLTLFEAISVTFLGGNAQAHNAVTKKRESFEDTLRGVKTIVDAGLPLTCFIVPLHGSCDGFGALIQELADAGVMKIRVLAVAPSGRARPIYREVVPDGGEIARLEGELRDAVPHYGMCVEAGYCTRLSLPRLAVLSGHEQCTSGLNRLHINSGGDMFPCTAASGVEELTLGNIRGADMSLEVLWRESRKLHAIRALHLGALQACDACRHTPKCRDGCMVNACGTMSEGSRMLCPVISER